MDKHLKEDIHEEAVGDRKAEIPDALKALKELKETKSRKKFSIVNPETKQKLRIEYTAFIIKNGLPFSKAEKFCNFNLQMLQKYGPDALEQVTISDKTAATITTDCISKTFKDQLVKELSEKPFAISIDESIDVYGPKYMACNVRYLKDGNFEDKFFGLVAVEGSETADALLELLLDEIFSGQKQDLLENVIGICTDGAKNMQTGVEGGLAELFVKKYPQVYKSLDICHLFNLVCNVGLKKFDQTAISMVKEVCSHFNSSPMARARLYDIQNRRNSLEEDNVLHILDYISTRWGSLLAAINRILILWEDLAIYFHSISEYHDSIPNFSDESRLSLRVLAYLLEKLQVSIRFFQTSSFDFSKILPHLVKAYCVWANSIIKPSENDFKTLRSINMKDNGLLNSYLLDDSSFNSLFVSNCLVFGDTVDMDNPVTVKLCKYTKEYMVAAFVKMNEILLLNDDLLQLTETINMVVFEKEQWLKLAKRFNTIIPVDKLISFGIELENFSYEFTALQTRFKETTNKLVFWHSLNDYELIQKLVYTILTILYSTVAIERVFSSLRDLKSIKRNKLEAEAIEACLFSFKEFKNIEDLPITETMLENYRNQWENKKERSDKKKVKSIEKKIEWQNLVYLSRSDLKKTDENIEIEREKGGLKRSSRDLPTESEDSQDDDGHELKKTKISPEIPAKERHYGSDVEDDKEANEDINA